METDMQTDGQLYKVLHKGEREFPLTPPPGGPVQDKSSGSVCPNTGRSVQKHSKHGLGLFSAVGRDELLLLGIIFLLISDKNDTDLPLVLALVYVLIS